MKKYELPKAIDAWIQRYLKQLSPTPLKPNELAKAILKASENYQGADSVTPWSSTIDQAAYLSYFFPLNYIRLMKVIDEAKSCGLLQDITSFVDYGCGPGTATKALMNDADLKIDEVLGIDSDQNVGKYFLDCPRTHTQLSFNTRDPENIQPGTMVFASYVVNELGQLPAWFLQADHLIIVEPSTKQMANQYQTLRNQLISEGYTILAPCPHQQACPMNQSRRDWCHDRVYWEQPEWFSELEKHLPIKNKSMTFSYLIASRKHSNETTAARVVGDAQVEKGKTRWMVCRSSDREFVSFLKRSGKPPLIYRGEQLVIDSEEKKGSEIRITHDNFRKL